MGLMTDTDRKGLAAIALDSAEQHEPSHDIVVNLRSYCVERGIDPSEGDLFVIAENAIAWQLKYESGTALHDQLGLASRSLKDRRTRERRLGARRIAGRRRTGLSALAEEFWRIGRPQRRSGRDRRSSGESRVLLKRRQIRRRHER